MLLTIMKPKSVNFDFTVTEMESLAENFIKAETGVEVDIDCYIDEEVGNIYFGIDEETLSEEEGELMSKKDLPPAEWFLMTDQIIEKSFGKSAYTVVDMEEYEMTDDVEKMKVSVVVDFDEYQKVNNPPLML